MLVHFLAWISRREAPGVETLNRHFCHIVFDHLYRSVWSNNVENVTGFQCGFVRHVRKKILSSLVQPLGIDVDLIQHMRSNLTPAFLWIIGDDQPEVTTGQLGIARVFPKRFEFSQVRLILRLHIAGANVPIAKASGPFYRRTSEPAHPDWRAWLLDRSGCQTGIFDLDVFPFER